MVDITVLAMRGCFDGGVQGAPIPFARMLANQMGPEKRNDWSCYRSFNHGGDFYLW